MRRAKNGEAEPLRIFAIALQSGPGGAVMPIGQRGNPSGRRAPADLVASGAYRESAHG